MQASFTETPGRVACLGEALVLESPEGERHLAGADANVAVGLAAYGVSAAFVSRIGGDDLGELVRAELSARGVDIHALEVDATRHTGRYWKATEVDADGEVRSISTYERAGSAASAMAPEFLDTPPVAAALRGASVVHCSGIAAALSPTCRALVRRLLEDRPGVSGLVSFDVNWREQLWPDGDPAAVVELANRADLVLVGGDEAIRVMGSDDPVQLRRILPDPATLVIKDGARRALAVDRDGGIVAVKALRVQVVEPVGAGDAFAAGYLNGVVRGEDALSCLRRGHIGAAATLTVRADSAPPPADDVMRRLLTCPPQEWEATTVNAAGFSTPTAE